MDSRWMIGGAFDAYRGINTVDEPGATDAVRCGWLSIEQEQQHPSICDHNSAHCLPVQEERLIERSQSSQLQQRHVPNDLA